MTFIHEILFILLCVLGIIADIIVIYIMCGKKEMRTVPNMLFANCMAAQICYLMCVMITDIVVMTETSSGYSRINVSTGLLFNLQLSLLVAILWSIFMVALDWLLADYFQRNSEIFRRRFLLVIAAIWGISLIGCLIRVFCHYALKMNTVHNYFLLPYCMLFIFTSFLQIAGIKRKPQNSTLMLNLVSVWLIMFLPLAILSIIAQLQVQLSVLTYYYILIFTQYCMGLQPIVNIILLFCLYRVFQESTRNTANRRDVTRIQNVSWNQNEQPCVTVPLNQNPHGYVTGNM